MLEAPPARGAAVRNSRMQLRTPRLGTAQHGTPPPRDACTRATLLHRPSEPHPSSSSTAAQQRRRDAPTTRPSLTPPSAAPALARPRLCPMHAAHARHPADGRVHPTIPHTRLRNTVANHTAVSTMQHSTAPRLHTRFPAHIQHILPTP